MSSCRVLANVVIHITIRNDLDGDVFGGNIGITISLTEYIINTFVGLVVAQCMCKATVCMMNDLGPVNQ